MQVDFCITANFLGKIATIQTGCSYTPSLKKRLPHHAVRQPKAYQ
jgi:hypothetical protein